MAIQAEEFLQPARELGFDFWAGVPCSYLKPFINYIIDAQDLTYVSSANEGDALATATGAALAGHRSVVMMQNSGLGNAVSPLTSLNWVFRIPALLIVTLRGDPEYRDEPQHELMGQVTADLLDTIRVPWQWFPGNRAEVSAALATATRHMDTTGRPFAFIMRKGTVAAYQLRSSPHRVPPDRCQMRDPLTPDAPLLSRRQVLRQIIADTPPEQSVVIASTGFNGRELFALADRPNHLYVVGSMGCASSLGLGLSMARPDLQVIVADGDGAALMRMGNLATIGAYGGRRFKHILLDNGLHESTGGQATVSPGVRFTDAAAACGYRCAATGTTAADISAFLADGDGPGFLHVRTAGGTPANLPRPDVAPPTVKHRLMRHLGVDRPWASAGT
jgi:phosphonopyruvate decarboxylase